MSKYRIVKVSKRVTDAVTGKDFTNRSFSVERKVLFWWFKVRLYNVGVAGGTYRVDTFDEAYRAMRALEPKRIEKDVVWPEKGSAT